MGVGMAVVLRENIPSEVEAFREDVWKEEPIYLDSSFAFFAAIAGGTPNVADADYFMKQFALYPEGKADADFTADVNKAMALADGYMDDKHHNGIGEGFMTGGIYVIRKGGEVQWAFQEKKVGHTGDAGDVLAAAKAAAAVQREAEPCCTGCTVM